MQLHTTFQAHTDAWQQVLSYRLKQGRKAKAMGWSSWAELIETALDRPLMLTDEARPIRRALTQFNVDRARSLGL